MVATATTAATARLWSHPVGVALHDAVVAAASKSGSVEEMDHNKHNNNDNNEWFQWTDNASRPTPSSEYEFCSTLYSFHDWIDDGDDSDYYIDNIHSSSTPQHHCRPCEMPPHLRWLKRIAIKVGRSYYALPIALIVATLCVGVAVGYWLGRRRQHQKPLGPDSHLEVFPSRWKNLWIWVSIGWTGSWWRRKSQSDDNVFHDDSVLASNATSTMKDISVLSLPKTATISPTPEESLTADDTDDSALRSREDNCRTSLLDTIETRDSGLPLDALPRHVAVIMDGNRRYGRRRYNHPTRGHWDGSRQLLHFCQWCLAEHIAECTVYAFSTENWTRDPAEVAAIFGVVTKHAEELRTQALEQGIVVRVLSNDRSVWPTAVRVVLERLERDTQAAAESCPRNNEDRQPPRLRLNVALSYGSRDELVHACRNVAAQHKSGELETVEEITETTLSEHLLLSSAPDLLLRTSGEVRMSNFLLWQLAYAELFFVDALWPELTKADFVEVLRSYARRQRRFGA